MPTHALDATDAHPGNGARLVSTEGRDLPLKSVALSGRAGGGIARVTLEQVFGNPYGEPLELTYKMPLPADAAVSGYTIRIGERTLQGVIERRAAARKIFDAATLEGRSAALLDQERSSLFTQRIGNVPPGAEVRVGITVDMRLAWLPEGSWEWRFPTVVAPRYLGAEGRVADPENVAVEVAGSPLPVRASLELVVEDRLPAEGRIESPSHAVRSGRARGEVAAREDGSIDAPEAGTGDSEVSRTVVTFPGEGSPLDRDIVVRWAVSAPECGLTLRRARPAAGAPSGEKAYGLLSLVPPAAIDAAIPRDLLILIDTSGSMAGAPLDQARRLAGLLIDSLDGDDTLDLVAFSTTTSRFRAKPIRATAAARREAAAWIGRLDAGGGTEMVAAVTEGLRPLRPEAQRQVVLITDGLAGFEGEVTRSIKDGLPAGCRLHVVGIGPACNRSLTAAAARAGRGREMILGLTEDAERGAARLLAATRAPVLTDVVVEGPAVIACAPRRAPDLLAGAPCLAAVELRPEGGELTVRGRGPEGHWERRLRVGPTAPGEGDPAIAALYARECVEDLEMDLAAGSGRTDVEDRIERLGLDFGIATRLTSWIAVSERQDVDPRDPRRIERIPQELPAGLSAIGLGLAAPASMAGLMMSGAQHASPLFAEDAEPDYLRIERAAMQRRVGGTFGILRTDRRGAFRQFLESLGIADPGAFPDSLREALVARWAGRAPGGAWVLEFEVRGDPLAWDPRTRVLVDVAGRLEEREVDPDASTRRGRFMPGTLVRLAIRVPDDVMSKAKALFVLAGGETLVLRVAS